MVHFWAYYLYLQYLQLKRKLLSERFRHYNWLYSDISEIGIITLMNPNQLIN